MKATLMTDVTRILSAMGKGKYGRTLATVILPIPVATCRAGEEDFVSRSGVPTLISLSEPQMGDEEVCPEPWSKDVLVRGEDKGGHGSPGVRHPTLADMISMRSLAPDLRILAPTICRRSLGNISSFFWISFSMLLRTPASSSSSALGLNRRYSRM